MKTLLVIARYIYFLFIQYELLRLKQIKNEKIKLSEIETEICIVFLVNYVKEMRNYLIFSMEHADGKMPEDVQTQGAGVGRGHQSGAVYYRL